MRRVFDLTGHRFGRLTVQRRDLSAPTGRGTLAKWVCICDCGNNKIVIGRYLRIGITSSCGCLHKERLSAMNRTHGKSATPEYHAWHDMGRRCYNHKNQHYKDYGGRGISVCEQWRNSFETFLQDVGLRPTNKHTLDRIDNDGNYQPGNVRWATQKEQSANKRYRRSNTGITGVRFIGHAYEVMLARRYIGRFSTLEEAIEARKRARV